MFNMRNVVIIFLNELIKNFFKRRISKVPNKNVSDMTQQIHDVCEFLAESKALLRETSIHILTGITRCSMTEFAVTFEVMLNTYFISQI